MNQMAFAYYPGCSLHATGEEYDISTRAVCETLGIDLLEVPDWNCCGASSAHATDHWLSVALPARNLAKVGAMKRDVVLPCPACFARFKAAQLKMDSDEFLCAEINKTLEQPYESTFEIKHLLQVITPQLIKDRIVKSLPHLKAVPYYGCLLTRPPKLSIEENIEHPQTLDQLLHACEVEVLSWPFKTQCCGAQLGVTKIDAALKLTHELLDMAEQVGANCLIVACPLCHANLDMRQEQINQKYHRSFSLPVFYFTQILGLAMGMDSHKLGLEKHLVDTRGVIRDA